MTTILSLILSLVVTSFLSHPQPLLFSLKSPSTSISPPASSIFFPSPLSLSLIFSSLSHSASFSHLQSLTFSLQRSVSSFLSLILSITFSLSELYLFILLLHSVFFLSLSPSLSLSLFLSHH